MLGQYQSDVLGDRAALQAQLLSQGFGQAQQAAGQAFGQGAQLAGLQAGLGTQQFGLSNFQRQGMGADISALGSLGALRQGLDQARLTATQQAEQATALEPYGRLERYGTALTGLSGGVGTPSIPTQTPNPFGQALSNALGIGNLLLKW